MFFLVSSNFRYHYPMRALGVNKSNLVGRGEWNDIYNNHIVNLETEKTLSQEVEYSNHQFDNN